MAFGDAALTAYVLVLAALLGLVMGSFVNCWAWRYVRGESVIHGRSHCADCGHALSARDLVPVVSWLASGRKCRYCGRPVSARYPATELLCAAAFAGLAAVYGPTAQMVELAAFTCILLFLSLVDLETRIIPNGCIVAALAVRVAYLALAWACGWMQPSDLLYYAGSAFGVGVAMLVVVLVADRLFGRESMGGGDLKLFFAAALYFGWQQSFFLIIVSCLVGIMVAFASPVRQGGAGEGGSTGASGDDAADEGLMKRSIPFGPSIALACVITALVGNQVLGWYLGLM